MFTGNKQTRHQRLFYSCKMQVFLITSAPTQQGDVQTFQGYFIKKKKTVAFFFFKCCCHSLWLTFLNTFRKNRCKCDAHTSQKKKQLPVICVSYRWQSSLWSRGKLLLLFTYLSCTSTRLMFTVHRKNRRYHCWDLWTVTYLYRSVHKCRVLTGLSVQHIIFSIFH